MQITEKSLSYNPQSFDAWPDLSTVVSCQTLTSILNDPDRQILPPCLDIVFIYTSSHVVSSVLRVGILTRIPFEPLSRGIFKIIINLIESI